MGQMTAGSLAARDAAGPRSLNRLLGLFDALAKSRGGLTLAELNTVLDSPKSSLLNLLRPLVSDGYLSHDGSRYLLGPSIFRLAATIMSVWNFSNVLRPYLEELAQRSGESAYVGVLDRADKVITYVDSIDSPHSVRYSIPIGAVRPLYATAAGRVLLAYADEEFVENYLRSTKLEALTPRTTSTRKSLCEALTKVREERISISIGEMFPESAGISAPIFGANGLVIAAIAVGAPAGRLEPKLPGLRTLVLDVAARASGLTTRLGKTTGPALAVASINGRPLRR